MVLDLESMDLPRAPKRQQVGARKKEDMTNLLKPTQAGGLKLVHVCIYIYIYMYRYV